MSAILLYSEDHGGFDYFCPGFDMEHDALEALIEREDFEKVTEKWSSEEDEEEIIIVKRNDKLYKVEFLYLDEPTIFNLQKEVKK